MGEANSRGTPQERREEALWRNAEVIIFLKADGKSLSMGVMPQSDTPDQGSLAMIFAGFLNANFAQLLGLAQKAYQSSRTAIPGFTPPPPSEMGPAIVTDATPRIIGANGPATGEVRLVDPDGKPLQ